MSFDQAGPPLPTRGRTGLSRLVALDRDRFAAEVWGRAPLLTPAADLCGGFGDLFSDDAVDELVSRRGLRAPFVRVAKDGRTRPDRDFTRGGGVGATIGDQVSDDDLLRLLGEGSTIVLQGLHRTWAPLVELTQELAADLGHPVQANAYVTPPGSTGFSAHHDVHDVFVLQVSGEKDWQLRPPVHEHPLRDQPWTDHRDAVEAAAARPASHELTLGPGDCLYLPRGWVHSATARGGVSTHLTIGVHPWTGADLGAALLDAARRRLADDPHVRASLPLGVDVGDPGTWGERAVEVRAALTRALTTTTDAELADALAARERSAQRAAPVAPLATLAAATGLPEGGDTRLVVRPHLAGRLVDGVLLSRAGRLPLHADERPVVEALLAGRAVSGTDHPDLARRLLLAGVAVVADGR